MENVNSEDTEQTSEPAVKVKQLSKTSHVVLILCYLTELLETHHSIS